jgi:hypothetical protein
VHARVSWWYRLFLFHVARALAFDEQVRARLLDVQEHEGAVHNAIRALQESFLLGIPHGCGAAPSSLSDLWLATNGMRDTRH